MATEYPRRQRISPPLSHRRSPRHNVGFIGAGVGLVVAGIGGYPLLTGEDPDRYRKPAAIALHDAAVWWDERGGGLALARRF